MEKLTELCELNPSDKQNISNKLRVELKDIIPIIGMITYSKKVAGVIREYKNYFKSNVSVLYDNPDPIHKELAKTGFLRLGIISAYNGIILAEAFLRGAPYLDKLLK